MRRTGNSRGRGPDLLARPPCPDRAGTALWTDLAIDPIEQVRALADLLDRGLLSQEEFEQQKLRIFGS